VARVTLNIRYHSYMYGPCKLIVLHNSQHEMYSSSSELNTKSESA